jgi:hypothetical protein
LISALESIAESSVPTFPVIKMFGTRHPAAPSVDMPLRGVPNVLITRT